MTPTWINGLVTYRVRIFFILTILLITSLFIIGSIHVSGSLNGLEATENEEYIRISRVESIFGHSDNIYLIVFPKSDDRRAVFKEIDKFQEELIKRQPDIDIISPVTIFKNLQIHSREEITALSEFYEKASDIPLLKQLIGRDKRSFVIAISTTKENLEAGNIVNSLLAETELRHLNMQILSNLEVHKAVKKQIETDLGMILISISLLFLVFTLIAFRSLLAGLFILIILSMAMTSTYMLYGFMKIDFNVVSMIALPVVLILALSDSLHLLTGYKKLNSSSTEDKLKQVLQLYYIPSFYSSLTTAIAFFTFYLFGESENIRELGLLASAALIMEFFLIFSIAPFLLSFQPKKGVKDYYLISLAKALKKGKKPITGLFVIVFILSLFIYPKLQFQSNPEAQIPDGTNVKLYYNYFKTNYFSPFNVNILIEPTGNQNRGTFKAQVKEISEAIKEIPNVSAVQSATNTYYIKTRMGLKVNLYNLLENNSPYYNEETNTYRIEVKLNDVDNTQKFKDSVLTKFASKEYNLDISSRKLLYDSANLAISSSLIKSMGTAGIGIFMVLLFLTKSIKTAILSLFPNLFPLALAFLIMFLFDIDLFFSSVITLVIGLGLLDDNTVHIIYRKLWLKKPMEELNFSVLTSSLLLSCGFFMFTLSKFEPIRLFGWISVLIFISGVIAEMTTMKWIIDSVINKDKNNEPQ